MLGRRSYPHPLLYRIVKEYTRDRARNDGSIQVRPVPHAIQLTANSARKLGELGMSATAEGSGSPGQSLQPPRVPPGWVAKWSSRRQSYFYHQISSNQTSWELPTEPVSGLSPTPSPDPTPPQDTHLRMIQHVYDQRAPTYDAERGFRSELAADFVGWMKLESGLRVLDLACGTGFITIPAARAVGLRGEVTGVDISHTSLKMAEEKAKKEVLHTIFIQHDIESLERVDGIGNDFDVISCGSALNLLKDPAAAVKRWAKLLAPEGRLIFDVPAEKSMVAHRIMEVVAEELGLPMLRVYDKTDIDTLTKIRSVLEDAGLDPGESFLTESYSNNVIYSDEAEEVFEETISGAGWNACVYAELHKPTIRGITKDLFCSKLKAMAEPDGKIEQELRLNIGIGKKAL
ncbi:hypothetical protein B7494_g6182 [Chlorociboria aeruginascens]|nr:hypothetical protein B7494_g6182 [Chlorociboria aeruginascens]